MRVLGPRYAASAGTRGKALSLATGTLLWEHQVNTPEVSGPGPNGVAVGAGRMYGTGAIAYQHQLPTSTNAPIAIAGNSVIVPAGAPGVRVGAGRDGQLVVYTVP